MGNLVRSDFFTPRWMCVFITAGPITKMFAWGRRRVEVMCYERRRAEACVDESANHANDGVVFGFQGVHRELDHFVLGGIMYFGEVADAPHLGLDSGQTCCPIHGLTMHLENACVSNAQGN